MSEVLPFPYARRLGFIGRQACFLQFESPVTAEKHLRAALKVQRETMERRGIAPDRIAAELRAAELAIRFAAGLSVPLRGGDAA